ncbi:MAG: asparagine synthase-related protein [Reyranella sp.]|nr:asparagine synthase-related protein [Reyranella sp.]
MFAVVLATDGGPVVPRLEGIADHHVEVVGVAGRVAFICSKPGPASAEAGATGIQSLGGRYWIAGRLRLDARGELRSLLSDRMGSWSAEASDAQLCLHAYAVWGDGFVDRLRGDFCFVLWDSERNRLVCVRDQLGARALFHAEAGGTWFASDSLDWIAAQPPVDRDLDDTWIADFLGVGHGLEFERTVYRHIRRLAPAHVLAVSDAGATERRYWRLDIAEPLYFRDRRLYAERFLDLLSQAIADRLPAGRVGISMSGGLDSTALAACAVQATGNPSRVAAECTYFERLMPDEEPHFSTLAARHLGIELRLRAIDDLTYDPQWRSRSIRTAEPQASIVSAHPDQVVCREQAAVATVWFQGEGPDNALVFERDAYLSWLIGRRDWRHLAEAVVLYVRTKGMSGWMATFRRYAGRRRAIEGPLAVPPWLDRALVRRVDLEERLRGVGAAREPRHPWHPQAVASFNDPIWSAVFADLDHEETLAPLVWRHPFLDLRVLEFMLSMPPVPWAREKLLLRQAMRGRLPDQVLDRRKSPLPASPMAQPIRTHGLPALSASHRLDAYVDVGALPAGIPAEGDLDRIVAVHALDYWLAERTP